MWIQISAKDSRNFSRQEIGDKGVKLMEIAQAGLRMPRFGILDTHFYDSWKDNPEKTLSEHANEIRKTVESWGGTKLSFRLSLGFADENLLSVVGDFSSRLNVAASELESELTAFLSRLHNPEFKGFLDSQRPSTANPDEVAIIIQEMVTAECSGIFFSEAPTVSSGLYFLEATPSSLSSLLSTTGFKRQVWLEPGGKVWRESRNYTPSDWPNESYLPFKELIEVSERLSKKNHFPLEFEWIIDKRQQLMVINYRTTSEGASKLETFSSLPIQNLIVGPCSPLTLDLYQRLAQIVVKELQAERLLPDTIESTVFTGLVEPFGSRLFVSINLLQKILDRNTGAENLLNLFSHRESAPKQRSQIGVSAFFNSLRSHRKLQRNYRKNLKKLKSAIPSLESQIREHTNILESLHKSRDVSRLLETFLENLSGLSYLVRNEYCHLVALSELQKLAGDQFDELIAAGDYPWSEVVGSAEAYGALEKLVEALKSNPEFYQSVEAFLAKSPEAGQLGDIYYWLRYQDFHHESDLIFQYLSNYGHMSFFDLRIESPDFESSPRAFFELLLFLRDQPEEERTLKNIAASESSGARDQSSKSEFFLSYLMRRYLKLLFSTLRTRQESRSVFEKLLQFVRRALFKQHRLLLEEVPKLFQEGEDFPDLHDLNLQSLLDYGREAFGADVLLDLKRRNQKATHVMAEAPEIFRFTRSEGQPHFLSGDSPSKSPDSHIQSTQIRGRTPELQFIGEVVYVDKPSKLIQRRSDRSIIFVGSTPLQSWLLFSDIPTPIVFKESHGALILRMLFRELGKPALEVADLPSHLKTDGALIKIRSSGNGILTIEKI